MKRSITVAFVILLLFAFSITYAASKFWVLPFDLMSYHELREEANPPFDILMQAVSYLGETPVAASLWLMAGCGLRVSEVATLKVEHLDGPGGYLHVVDGKGGKQRTSILPRPVLEALVAHLLGRAGGYVFEGRDQGHISTRQIQRLLHEAAETPTSQRGASSR